ncbi:MAG: hypothetical protein OHK0046_00470 [Anaerolineae bacterium]
MPAAAQSTPCEEGTRPFEHALGTACVPETVERIVTLEWTYTENVLALGVQPVGVADIEGYQAWVDIPVTLGENITDVGTRQEPNLELIAQLNPDLILTASLRAANNFDELNAIAPTLAFNPYPEDGASHYDEMLTTFRTIAEALGQEEAGEQVLAELEGHFAEAQAALTDAGRADETFILAQGWVANDAATFRLFTDNAMAVQILEQIGLENAWDDAPQLYGFTEVSFEGFAGVDDTNFFYVAQADANDAFADSALWNGLPFVQSERAYWLGGDVWLFGGPLSAELLVNTVLAAMGVEMTAAEAAEAQADTTGTCETGFRLFDSAFLATDPVCVPEDPQRIVIADFAALDVMYTLDIEPVGMWNLLLNGWYANMVPELIPSLGAFVGDAGDIGAIPLNLEAILATNPDLILVNSLLVPDDAAYEQFSAIAPTVVKNETSTDDWREYIRFYGEALNVADDVEALLAEYDARLDTLRVDSEGLFEGKSATLVQMNDPATIYLSLPVYRGWLPLGEVGFVGTEEQYALAEALDAPDVPLSTEEVALLDTDYLIVMNAAFDPENSSANAALFESYQEDPLWSLLPALQNNHFYLVDLAWQANGLISAHAVIDDMYRLFLNQEPSTPNPYAERMASVGEDTE